MSTEADLSQLLVRCLEELEDGGAEAMEALLAEHPQHAQRLRARLAALQEAGLVGSGWTEGSFPERLGDFRLLRRLGSGGMGIVYLAHQESLSRRVALKLIRPDQLYFGGARERFQREVEAVARLAHPGIVPVHSVGVEQGIPYFAMEYVEGMSLDLVITALRERPAGTLRGSDLYAALMARGAEDGTPDDPMFTGSWTQACVWIAREVAQALEHAHQRGVLHRDVKPSNVLLTAGGRVLLCDFGLASSGGSERLTRTGSQLGSLPYMAPEQVRGEDAGADARTDVYGLGVTLYELLTLKPAFAGSQPADVMRRVLDARPAAPRSLVPQVSRDLETVVATAMEPDLVRRYGSVADLARDLTHVLERRPIDARPAGAWLQLLRWCQRQPGAASAFALTVLIAVGWPTQRALQSARDAERERGFSADLSEQMELAERGFARSREAVQSMLARVADEKLVDIPRMDTVRRELLVDALRLYDELQVERPGEEGLARERALVARSLAEFADAVGDTAEALERFDAEIARGRARLTGESADAADRILLAGMLNSRGRVDSQNGNPQEACARFREALEIQRGLVRDSADPELRHDLAIMALNLGLELRRLGDATASAALDEALGIARRLHDEWPQDSRFGRLLAQVNDVSALELRAQGRADEVERRQLEGIAIYEELLTTDPHDRALRHSFCQCLANRALTLFERGEFEAGALAGERAREMARMLVEDFPQVDDYRLTLAGACINEGIQHAEVDDPALALERFEQATGVCRELLDHDADNYRARLYLTASLAHAGDMLADLGRRGDALEALAEARDLSRGLLALLPDGHEVRYYAGMASMLLGATLVARGELPGALEHLDEAAQTLERPGPDLLLLARTWMDAFAAVEADSALEGERAVSWLDHCAEGALDALEKASSLEDWSSGSLDEDPSWSPLRGHPRFKALAR